MQFEGRKVLVTGGGAGIGLALTRQLVAHGATVIAVGRKAEKLNSAAATSTGKVIPLVCDLADRQQVSMLIDHVVREHPDLSALINNAGVHVHTDFTKPLTETGTDDLYSEIAINFAALAHLTHGLVPVLSRQTQSMIINISSGLGVSPKRSAPVYCATKAAVRSLTKSLRYQFERDLPQILIADAVMALVDTDLTAGRGKNKISPDTAAREVLAGAARNARTIWVGKAKLLRIIHRLSPALADRILRDG